MFDQAKGFNADISKWDVGKVTDMVVMFDTATAFNSDLSEWHVGNVVVMNGMFSEATFFNHNISKWDVGNVKYMNDMFNGASAFSQTLCGLWKVSKAQKKKDVHRKQRQDVLRRVILSDTYIRHTAVGMSLSHRTDDIKEEGEEGDNIFDFCVITTSSIWIQYDDGLLE